MILVDSFVLLVGPGTVGDLAGPRVVVFALGPPTILSGLATASAHYSRVASEIMGVAADADWERASFSVQSQRC